MRSSTTPRPGCGLRTRPHSEAELAAAGIGPAACEYLRARHHPMPCTAMDYPRVLRPRAQRPLDLNVAGHLDTLKDPALAVVGSRRTTFGGMDTAFEFFEVLRRAGSSSRAASPQASIPPPTAARSRPKQSPLRCSARASLR